MGLEKYNRIYVAVSKFVISLVILVVGGFFSLWAIFGVHSGQTFGEIVLGGIVALLTIAFIVMIWMPAQKDQRN